jgi:NAD(P)-dependent dehydrogenase (short-subunit alcohol dehydrogenase family)
LAYSAVKAGVIAFTKSLAKELAVTGIRVNSVAPAAIETVLLKQMAPEVVAAMIAKSPMPGPRTRWPASFSGSVPRSARSTRARSSTYRVAGAT